MNQQRATRTRTAAPGEVIYSEGYGGEAVVYLITDGKVQLSTHCDDKTVVLATLGKGEFFGEAAILPPEPRTHTAKALTFCQLTVVEASAIEQELERSSPLVRHMVRTLVRRARKRDEMLAAYTRADFLPAIVSYAHVLALMATSENVEGINEWTHERSRRSDEVSIPLAEVVKRCRAIAGHSRARVMTMLKRMERLNLIAMDGKPAEFLGNVATRPGSADSVSPRHHVVFDPARITERAQQVANDDLDTALNSELELIDLAELEALIAVDKAMILSKLSHGEIAEDVFAFRKSRVLNYVEQKGTAYFSRRNPRKVVDVQSLDDLQYVDQRTLFEAVGQSDSYDLAKLFASNASPAAIELLQSVMAEARRNEISWIMRRGIKVDPVELGDIEQRLLDTVKAIRSAVAAGAEPPAREG
ncbi:Crp/Fnr family transcriptional regulator [Paraburkholderia phosphatilytica]|uniref:Crp/Fnr family transcriptional regulator n=1 Tax=Paraburkholderia phosphatilytica TaxID=2282883 RepID=UPI000E4E7DF9|nr:Crp/Fnr family transcriptional regulator [Paraburkholderia phosphatilytica]